MGAKTKTVGGSKGGRSVSANWEEGLNALLNPGRSVGSPAGGMAVEQTGGIMGVLSDILAGGGGNVGGSLATLLEKSQERNVNNIRSRFGAGGGMAFGTPGAYAESLYRAEAAPQIATQVGQLQLSAVQPLIQGIMQMYGINTPQAQTIQQKSTLGQIAGTVGQLAPIAGQFFAPGLAPVAATSVPGLQRGNQTQSMGL